MSPSIFAKRLFDLRRIVSVYGYYRVMPFYTDSRFEITSSYSTFTGNLLNDISVFCKRYGFEYSVYTFLGCLILEIKCHD